MGNKKGSMAPSRGYNLVSGILFCIKLTGDIE